MRVLLETDSVWPARSWIPAPRRTSWSSCWCRRCSRSERGYSTAGGKNGLRHQWGVEPSPSKQICRQHRHPREAALWRRQQKPEDPPQLSTIWPFCCNNRSCLDTQLTTCLYKAFWKTVLNGDWISCAAVSPSTSRSWQLNAYKTELLTCTWYRCLILRHSQSIFFFKINPLVLWRIT